MILRGSYVGSKTNKQTQVHRYKEQIGCQRQGMGGEMGDGGQKVQTSICE